MTRQHNLSLWDHLNTESNRPFLRYYQDLYHHQFLIFVFQTFFDKIGVDFPQYNRVWYQDLRSQICFLSLQKLDETFLDWKMSKMIISIRNEIHYQKSYLVILNFFFVSNQFKFYCLVRIDQEFWNDFIFINWIIHIRGLKRKKTWNGFLGQANVKIFISFYVK